MFCNPGDSEFQFLGARQILSIRQYNHLVIAERCKRCKSDFVTRGEGKSGVLNGRYVQEPRALRIVADCATPQAVRGASSLAQPIEQHRDCRLNYACMGFTRKQYGVVLKRFVSSDGGAASLIGGEQSFLRVSTAAKSSFYPTLSRCTNSMGSSRSRWGSVLLSLKK